MMDTLTPDTWTTPTLPVNNVEYVASAVPAWLADASAQQREHYASLVQRSLASQAQVQALCDRFEAADAFIETRLNAALKAHYRAPVDLRGSELISLHTPLRNPNWQVRRTVEVKRGNLLQAAMSNFTARQADGGFELGSVILPTAEFVTHTGGPRLYSYDAKKAALINPTQFAHLCRELDIGAQYQRHFADVFEPAGQVSPSPLQVNLCNDFAVQLQRAVLSEAVDVDAAKALQALLDAAEGEQTTALWNQQPVQLHSLRLLVTWVHGGTTLQRACLFTQAGDEAAPCVAYLPGDPLHPLKQYRSLRDFSDALRQRLRETSFQEFFKSFVGLNEQSAFLQRLVQTLNPGTLPGPGATLAPADPSADIGLRTTALQARLASWLHSQLLEQMRSDAQTLLVPNAVVDRQVRSERWQTLLMLGLDAVEVAAAFVPALGLLMVGAGALQLLGEVFEGVDDWNHGQRQEALQHLLSVAENAALIGITAGVGVAMHRAPFVEGLLPVLDRTGRTRLLDAPLSDFASPEALADEAVANTLGQYSMGDHTYIKLDGKAYRQSLDSTRGQWAIEHPRKDYRVLLSHDGAGHWRAAHVPTEVVVGHARAEPSRAGQVLYQRRLRRMRELYPQLDDDQLQSLHESLGAAPDVALARRAIEYRQMRHTLETWARQPATTFNDEGVAVAVEPVDRGLAMSRILAAWRRESPTMMSERGRGRGFSLDLSDLRIGDLPALRADFSHVYSLILEGMAMEQLPAGFLRNFPRVEELELQGNRLTAIPTDVGLLSDLNSLTLDDNRLQASPTMFDGLLNLNDLQTLVLRNNPMHIPAEAASTLGSLRALRVLSLENTSVGHIAQLLPHLARLPHLESLWLCNNELVLTPEVARDLAAMPELEHLELAGNPLGEDPDFASFTYLAVLGLRDCQLTRWPRGLSELMGQNPLNLRSVSLDGNPLTEVPELQGLGFFEGDDFIEQPLRISAAGLDEVSLGRLRRAGVVPVDRPRALDDWRVDCPEAVLSMAQQLRADADAGFFFHALDRAALSAEYTHDPQGVRQRIHALIRALAEPGAGDDGAGLRHVREQVFRIGDEAVNTCGDGVQLLLRRSETLVLAYRAGLAPGDEGQAKLLKLARQLYRADLLDDAAVRITQMRLNRRAFLMGTRNPMRVTGAQWQAIDPTQLTEAPALYPGDDHEHALLMFPADEAEIRLSLRQVLAARLNLQPQSNHLLFPEAISTSLQNEVATAVQQQDSDTGFLDWLEDQPFWTDALERRYRPQFDELDRTWNEGHTYLYEIGSSEPQPEAVTQPVREVLTSVLGDRGWYRDGQMQVVSLTADEQDTARQALNAGQAAARRALQRQLSEQALGGAA
ncbi:dermonecrotic toxin domain-containing protein [Pseudomonas sp. UBA4194]|uniref:dermonecrotic toxin domain-containing protein n=1 Tax=Pseudomonas sp. UBA4194 TaxID=1947317 RepID=UPI0025CDA664|nr:DUF6543 domain-containing protein [Pseudomonas sp. UBA4194]